MHVSAKHLWAILAVLSLGACSSPPPATHSPSLQGCNAEAVHSMIGKTATPALLEKARELAGAQRARVLRPNDVVTLEYDSQRLNLHTDEELTIERIHCG